MAKMIDIATNALFWLSATIAIAAIAINAFCYGLQCESKPIAKKSMIIATLSFLTMAAISIVILILKS